MLNLLWVVCGLLVMGLLLLSYGDPDDLRVGRRAGMRVMVVARNLIALL